MALSLGGRWQLPVHSPLPLGSLVRVAMASMRAGHAVDPRSTLAHSLAAEFRAGGVALYGSGTMALEGAIRYSRAIFGGRVPVALPAYSCFDLVTAVIGTGSPIMLYDVDPATLGPDLDSLCRALADGARVVVIAALYGMPTDWAAVEALAKSAGALVVEDAAQGQGATWRGKPLGSLGSVSVLSFGRGKGWSGVRGGALLVRSGEGLVGVGHDLSELWARAPARPDTAASIILAAGLQWALGRPRLYGVPASIPWLGLGETRYRDPVPPQELAPVSAMILETTKGLAYDAAMARRRLASSLLAQLAPLPGIRSIAPVAGAVPGYLRLPLRISGGGRGDRWKEAARRLGISGGYPSTLAMLAPVRAGLVGRERFWPGAEELVRELVTLPTHGLLRRSDLDQIVSFLGGSRGIATQR